jgi:hypothetical protein
MQLTWCRAPNRIKAMRIAFIGSVGVPNRYGGFESFLEHCAPILAADGHDVVVTCDRFAYQDNLCPRYKGVIREVEWIDKPPC